MIAKLVVWSEDRNKALKKLRNKLSDYKILGLKTNIPFLMKLSDHKEFKKGNVYTNFISDFHDDLFPKNSELDNKQRLVKLAIGLTYSELIPNKSKDPFYLENSFRNLNLIKKVNKINLLNPDTNEQIKIKVEFKSEKMFDVTINDEKYENINAKLDLDDNEIQIDFNGFKTKCSFLRDEQSISLFEKDEIPLNFEIVLPNYLNSLSELSTSESDVVSPMPGVVEKILVKEGEEVKKGDILAIIIAMKMEYQIKSNKDQKVDKILHKSGDNVSKGTKLISFFK